MPGINIYIYIYICGVFFKKHFALSNLFTHYVFAIFDRLLAALFMASKMCGVSYGAFFCMTTK